MRILSMFLPLVAATLPSKKAIVAVLAIGLVASESAEADLISRLGGSAVYDTDLDITWMADANALGTATWDGAVGWADDLTLGGFSDWRLPSAVEPDPTCEFPSNSSGFNCTGSEMGHLFYDELGGIAGSPISTSTDPDLGLFTDIQDDRYWTGTEDPETHAWIFRFEDGQQDGDDTSLNRYAWAVRDGDSVPEPSTSTLLGFGLLGLALASKHEARRRARFPCGGLWARDERA